jgi:hypothetical protein
MAAWLEAFLPFVVAVLLLFVPGAGVALLLGARGWFVAAIAPAISVGVYAAAAIVLPFARLPWGVPGVAGVFAVIAVAAAVIGAVTRRLTGASATPGDGGDAGGCRVRLWSPVPGILIGAAIVGGSIVRMVGVPTNFAAEYDNQFHLNAIRYIVETGNASSLTIQRMVSDAAAPGIYPAGWHDFNSLIVLLTGTQVTVAVTAATLAVGSLVWVLGCVMLARALFGGTVRVSSAAGLMSASFTAFPLLMLDWGTLYPYFLGLSLMPAAILAVIRGWGIPLRLSPGPRSVAILALGAMLPGIGLAHPSVVVLLLLVSCVVAAQIWWQNLRPGSGQSTGRRVLWTATMVIQFAVLVTVWIVVSPPRVAAGWLPRVTQGQAVGEVLTGSFVGRPLAVVVSALVILGGVVAWRRRQQWLVVMYLLVAVLYVYANGVPEGPARRLITGLLYKDAYRFAALLAVFGVSLATGGFLRVWRLVDERAVRLQRWASTGRRENSMRAIARAVPVLATVLLLACTVVFTQRGVVQGELSAARTKYRYTASSPVLTRDELKLIKRLPEYIPPGALVINDPATGSAFTYALTRVHVTAMHTLNVPSSDESVLYTHLDDEKYRVQVCRAVRELNAYYVLDFGRQNMFSFVKYPGLKGLKPPFVELVAQQGKHAKLWKIVGCGNS